MKEKNQYEDLLNEQWPGMAEAMAGTLSRMETLLSDPWLGATIRADGPAKFKQTMAEQLKPELAKIPPEVLLDVASQLLTSLMLDCIKTALKERGDL